MNNRMKISDLRDFINKIPSKMDDFQIVFRKFEDEGDTLLYLDYPLTAMYIDEENQESVAKWQGALRNEKFSGWAKSEEVPLKEKYGVSVKKITQEVAAVSVEKIMQEVAAPAAQDKIRARKIRWGIE